MKWVFRFLLRNTEMGVESSIQWGQNRERAFTKGIQKDNMAGIQKDNMAV